MRCLHVFFICLLVVVLLCSCSVVMPSRRVIVRIPSHAWERCEERLWYTLKWTCEGQVHTRYVSKDERELELEIPLGETVLVAAYPLGDMNPFGCAITPLDRGAEFVLNQNDGYLVSCLLGIDGEVVSKVNYSALSECMKEVTYDYRCLDSTVFLRDLQNGELANGSIRRLALHGVEPFPIPNGIWISEYFSDSTIYVTDNLTCRLELPEGVFRYLNTELDRVLVLVVDSGGNTYSYLRQNLI